MPSNDALLNYFADAAANAGVSALLSTFKNPASVKRLRAVLIKLVSVGHIAITELSARDEADLMTAIEAERKKAAARKKTETP